MLNLWIGEVVWGEVRRGNVLSGLVRYGKVWFMFMKNYFYGTVWSGIVMCCEVLSGMVLFGAVW